MYVDCRYNIIIYAIRVPIVHTSIIQQITVNVDTNRRPTFLIRIKHIYARYMRTTIFFHDNNCICILSRYPAVYERTL